ncbi:MAG: hypothetical protein NTV70_13205 [Acidobacteria bacterium]|nr:hypothetical protein [Acidobacteriota bacterium]
MSKISVSLPEPGGRVSLSFEERSVWVQLISLLLVLGGYFIVAQQMVSRGVTELVVFAPVFAVAVVLMVVVTVAGHIVAALVSRPEGQDERDRLISWRAESQSGWLVATGVLAGITAMVFSVPTVWVAHLLLFSLFLSEILKLTLQLTYYRRGI